MMLVAFWRTLVKIVVVFQHKRHRNKSFSRFLDNLKDVRAHCYCASLVRTLFIGHARATSFSSARTESKTQQNIEVMTFALTWCANISVGRSVTPTFFSPDRSLFWLLIHYTKKQKKSVRGKFQLFLIFFLKRVELVHGYRCAWLRSCIF